MKKYIAIFFFTPFFAFSQNWDGNWKTELQGLEIFVEIQSEPLEVLLTIPAQGVIKEKANNSEITNERIDFYFPKFGASFFGEHDGKMINGTWQQGGRSFEMNFDRFAGKLSFERPQEPHDPYEYVVEELTFENKKDNISLAATLTKPNGDGPFPAIVLISGSGPQTRDSDIFKHKPFKLLADFYTKKGFAVLRYDDRGVGKSEGKFKGSTSGDFSYDAEAGLEYLRTRADINPNKVGFMGHSEGGLIAPMIAARNNNVGFLVLLAGPGTPINELMSYQLKKSYLAYDLSDEGKIKLDAYIDKILNLVSKDASNDGVVDQLEGNSNQFYLSLGEEDRIKLGPSEKAFYFSHAPMFLDPWMRYFLKYDPSTSLSKVRVPTLAVNGKKDVQVLSNPNLKAIKTAIKSNGNKNVKTKAFKKLNHLFQYSKTGEGSEYAVIEETFNVAAMEYINKWLQKQL